MVCSELQRSAPEKAVAAESLSRRYYRSVCASCRSALASIHRPAAPSNERATITTSATATTRFTRHSGRLSTCSFSERVADERQHAAPVDDSHPQPDSRHGHRLVEHRSLFADFQRPGLAENGEIEEMRARQPEEQHFPVKGDILRVLVS